MKKNSKIPKGQTQKVKSDKNVTNIKETKEKHIYRTNNTALKTIEKLAWVQVLRTAKQLLLNYWHQSCYSVDKAGIMSQWMLVTNGIGTDKLSRQWEIFIVICEMDNGQPNHYGDWQISGVMTLIFPWKTLVSVAFLSAATLY